MARDHPTEVVQEGMDLKGRDTEVLLLTEEAAVHHMVDLKVRLIEGK